MHNSKLIDNFAIEIDEKHTLDSFCPRFAGAHPLQSKSDEKHTINTLLAYNSPVRDPFRNGSSIGKSRRLYVSPSPHSAMKKWILFLLLLLALSACSRRISERIAVHDTLRVALTDTLR